MLSEKGVDLEERFQVEGPSGENSIPVGCIVDAMIAAPAHERHAIKSTLVRIDFANGNVRHFLAHLAQALAV